MRASLNLTPLCEGMDDLQFTALVRSLEEAGPNVEELKQMCREEGAPLRVDYMLALADVCSVFLAADERMAAYGKPPLFDMARLRDAVDGNVRNLDTAPLIQRYEYLMTEV